MKTLVVDLAMIHGGIKHTALALNISINAVVRTLKNQHQKTKHLFCWVIGKFSSFVNLMKCGHLSVIKNNNAIRGYTQESCLILSRPHTLVAEAKTRCK